MNTEKIKSLREYAAFNRPTTDGWRTPTEKEAKNIADTFDEYADLLESIDKAKPVAFIAPNGDLRKSCEAISSAEWGAEFKPLSILPLKQGVEKIKRPAIFTPVDAECCAGEYLSEAPPPITIGGVQAGTMDLNQPYKLKQSPIDDRAEFEKALSEAMPSYQRQNYDADDFKTNVEQVAWEVWQAARKLSATVVPDENKDLQNE